jgi:predicted nucleotidyltransferase
MNERPSPPEIPHQTLTNWAATKPTIKAVYVFGSYARGEARPDSDLDLAFDFFDDSDALAELIAIAAAWKVELTRLTGIVVKDLYLGSDGASRGPRAQVFSR